jgi:tripartite-type tricarboxylate transporter receptor subunit TctC
MSRKQFRPLAALSLILMLILPFGRVAAQSADEYFRNKTIRVVIPTAAGGDRSLYALPFIAYFGRHIPGNPTVVPEFMPGAGGAVAMNYLYNVARPDGLTMVTPLAPVVVAQATGDESVKYDVSKMNWIGRTVDATRVFFIWNTVSVRTIDDLRNRQVLVGSTGHSSETFIDPAIMNYTLGTKFKIVSGYKGVVDVDLAAERGETEGSFTTWDDVENNHPEWLRDKKITVLFQIALTKKVEEIPLLADFATTPQARSVIEFMSSSSQMGQAFVGPPNVPPDVVNTLRDSFDATMKDPEFLATMKKGNLEVNPMNGADLTSLVAKTIGAPKAVIDGYQAAVAAQ